MKKAAVLSITAFYLLLTTGMFVCMVHCAAESIAAKPAIQMAYSKNATHHEKNCTNSKDCDCCKKHGNYIIKENIKPASDVYFAQTAILIHHFEIAEFLLSKPVYINSLWQESNAPPGLSGKTISIQNRSLLI